MDFTEYLSKDPEVQKGNPSANYDLIANIVHDGEPGPGKGTYRVHGLHKVNNKLIYYSCYKIIIAWN